MGQPSLAGSSAALRYMDATQKRTGTTTAIILTGALGGQTVPAGPLMPIITRVVPDPSRRAESLSGEERDRAADVAGCPRVPADYPHGVHDPVVLSATATLLFVPCGVGNYNWTEGVLIATGVPGRRTFTLPSFDYDPGTGTAGLPPRVVNVVWDAPSGELRSERKGRSFGDCGNGQTYAWDGVMFRLVEARLMNQCRGAYAWITLWRTGRG